MPTQQEVLNTLQDFSIPAFQSLLSDLGYEPSDSPIYPDNEWQSSKAIELISSVRTIAHAGDSPFFEVIHIKLKTKGKLLISQERTVINQILNTGHPYALYLFSDASEMLWHLVNVRSGSDSLKRKIFRRITIGKEEKLRTAAERLSMIQATGNAIDIQFLHDEAFNVEAVTSDFFEGYKGIYEILQESLASQTGDKAWARDLALQTLNRLMFLYYIQRKRWLGDNVNFLSDFWNAYEKGNFFSDWLSVLFFKAFNRPKPPNCKQFPPEIRKVVQNTPYLNGGLFTENEVDTRYPFTIPDEIFTQVFDFMESYNFTIAEDTPLDIEVAVDPEMIGKVYESLVNVGTEEDLRGKSGIFYTPRIEIDLMCRLSLVDCLSNYLPDIPRSTLYEMVFVFDDEAKERADREADWKRIHEVISSLSVVDPAVGSGSFLVGMLNVLNDLEERASHYLKIKETSYERKKRIIGTSLYGVDAKEWVCHIAELRLWLSLIIDTDIPPEELQERKEPLLPYFTFKIRHGDALVQLLGDIDMNDVRLGTVPDEIRERIEQLKQDKLEFYGAKGKPKERIEKQEIKIFKDILRHRILAKEIEIDDKKGLFEDITKKIEVDYLEAQKEDLQRVMDKLDNGSPFVWNLSFAEVLEGKGGFDIVIGNPPYVRQEKIADPLERIDDKAKYKTHVINSAYTSFPDFFQVHSGVMKRGKSVVHGWETKINRPMDKKNDLYSYFYLRGLSLLNPKGSFCFITSNSWLDVGYGRDLQEFLLRHCHIKFIMDNEVKRSFASADVNTVICLFSSPGENGDGFEKVARFVMFRVPFEEVLPFGAVVFEEVEEKGKRESTEEYRVFPISQADLFEDGCE